jgi:thiazole synthase
MLAEAARRNIGMQRGEQIAHHMQLTINGEVRSIESPLTLAMLIEQLGLKLDRVAVEHNLTLLPRAQWASTTLSEGDRLEIVQFVGGGSSRSAK